MQTWIINFHIKLIGNLYFVYLAKINFIQRNLILLCQLQLVAKLRLTDLNYDHLKEYIIIKGNFRNKTKLFSMNITKVFSLKVLKFKDSQGHNLKVLLFKVGYAFDTLRSSLNNIKNKKIIYITIELIKCTTKIFKNINKYRYFKDYIFIELPKYN